MKSCFLFLVVLASSIVQGVILNVPNLGVIEGTNSTTAWTRRTIYKFLGVKFGKTTSGERRFMPPEPIDPWQDIYNATVEGIECPQIKNIPDIINAPPDADMEDCLLLNLFTPMIPDEQTTSELLPVMVYFHGGGFYEGSARSIPPDYLLEQDVILVVPQYRLGPLGFMSLQVDSLAGNVGLMDQVLALEWVNKNIKYFGGDNSKVTIFGQSAGGSSVTFHLISPIVDPKLFQQVIVMSGSIHTPQTINSDPIGYSKDLYRILTNTTNDVDISTMVEDFKNISLLELLLAFLRQSANPLMLYVSGRAVVQKAGSIKYITETPKTMFESGKFRTMPMMAGVTKHDGSFITTYVYDILEALNLLNNDDFMRNNLTKYLLEFSDIIDDTNTISDMFNDVYFRELFDKNNNLTIADVAPGITDIMGNLNFKGQVLKGAKINAKFSNQTYLYTMDYRGEHTRFGYGEDTSKYPFDGGVHHSDDLLYLFPYFYETPLNEEDTRIAKIMTQLWTNFAINGKPTSELLGVEWPSLEKNKNGPYLHINSTSYISKDFVNQEYKIASLESGLISSISNH